MSNYTKYVYVQYVYVKNQFLLRKKIEKSVNGR